MVVTPSISASRRRAPSYKLLITQCALCPFLSGYAFIESLRAYFSEFGKIDACTIMRDAAGRSRGFAFLTFEDAAAVNAVMVREHYLDGKVVSIFVIQRSKRWCTNEAR